MAVRHAILPRLPEYRYFSISRHPRVLRHVGHVFAFSRFVTSI